MADWKIVHRVMYSDQQNPEQTFVFVKFIDKENMEDLRVVFMVVPKGISDVSLNELSDALEGRFNFEIGQGSLGMFLDKKDYEVDDILDDDLPGISVGGIS